MIETLTGLFTSQQGLTELGILAIAFGISWLARNALRQWFPAKYQPGLAKFGAGSGHRLVSPLVMLVLVWVARLVLVKMQATPILNIAIPLIGAFAVIRLTVYLLRHMIPPSNLLQASERAIVYGVWLIYFLHLTGALTEIRGALSNVSFAVGKQNISLMLILEAILSAVVTIFVALGISGLIENRLMKSTTVDLSSRVVISKFVRAFALVLAVLIALPLVGIDLTVLSVFGGALGVGLGLGLQKIASNYISGFIILLDRSIRLGDLVTVDTRHGVVEAIKSRYTVIRSLDGTESIVPNDTLITNTVINHSYTDPVVLLKIPVTIGYECDVELARSLVSGAARAQSRILENPSPDVWVKALGDNGIELELVASINEPSHGQASLRSEILISIWREFKANGITVPFLQRDIRISNVPSTSPNSPNSPNSDPINGQTSLPPGSQAGKSIKK